jgi:hypothetical protein
MWFARFRLRVLVGLALAFLVSSPVTADEPTTGETPPSAVQPANSERPAVIYVPYRDLRRFLESPQAQAILPFGEYLSLLDALAGKKTALAHPATEVALTAAAYQVTVAEDLVQIRLELNAEVLAEGWSEASVNFGDAAISSVTCDTTDVILRSTAPGEYRLGFSKPGKHLVVLELSTRVNTSPEGRNFRLATPPVGVTRLELTVPGDNQDIVLQPTGVRLPVDPASRVAGSTRITALVGSTDALSARWAPAAGSKPDMELLASTTNATAITLQDGLVFTDTFLTYEVLRGRLETIRCAIPKGHRVLDLLADARIKNWTVTEEESGQIVTVELVDGSSRTVSLEIHTELDAENGARELLGRTSDQTFGIHALDVVRESGVLSVRAAAESELVIESSQGVARVAEGEVDERIRRPGASYFRYFSPSTARLSVSARPLVPKVLGTHLTQIVFREDQLRIASNFSARIERTGIFEMVFRLPPDFTVESVTGPAVKEFQVSDTDNTLTVRLLEKTTGALDISIVLVQPISEQMTTTEWTLTTPEPVGWEFEDGRILVYAPESLEVIVAEEGSTAVQPDPQPSAAANLGAARLVSSWIYNRRPVSLSITTSRKPTRLTARIGTLLNVQPSAVRVESTVRYLVEYAGLDTFRIAVPESVADAVQIELDSDGSLPPIRQRTRGDAEGGVVTWTVTLQREVLGTVPLRVTYDLPASADAAATWQVVSQPPRAIPPYAADSDRSVPLTRVEGEATVIRDRSLAVTAGMTGGDSETIDVRELTALPQNGIAAFRYFQQPVELTLSISKLEIQKVVSTVVSRGLVEIVIDRAGVSTVRARYHLRSSERQRLRIDLPAGLEPLGAGVNSQSVALERLSDVKAETGWEALAVNVSRTTQADESFSLAFAYRLPLTPPPFTSRGGTLLIRLPMLGGVKTEDIVVQQQRVAVWSPVEYSFAGTPRGFENDNPSVWRSWWESATASNQRDLDDWIGVDAAAMFDFPREGRRHVYSQLTALPTIELGWWHLAFYTAVVSGALALIAVVLRVTTWENKLTLIFGAIFVAALWSLFDADQVARGAQFASYGILAMIAIWILHGLLGQPRRALANAAAPGSLSAYPAAVIPPPGVFDSPTTPGKPPTDNPS